MSSQAPFATASSATSGDEHHGGRRRYDGGNQRSDAPFATNYPEQHENTPSKHVGRRRYEAQDAAHDAPFATGNDNKMFQEPPAASKSAPAVNAPPAGDARQQPIKPSDNSDVFRYDASAGETPTRAGRRRYQQDKQEAPFATFGDSDESRKNGSTAASGAHSGGGVPWDTSDGAGQTPRSAGTGGRRRFEDQSQKKPAPFAVDDGERFKNAPARSNNNNAPSADIAGSRRQDKNVPPPNSRGEGKEHRSQMRDCPFALN